MTLLDQIKTHARDDATLKALLELTNDDLNAMAAGAEPQTPTNKPKEPK